MGNEFDEILLTILCTNNHRPICVIPTLIETTSTQFRLTMPNAALNPFSADTAVHNRTHPPLQLLSTTNTV
jgi:hypothetical protein